MKQVTDAITAALKPVQDAVTALQSDVSQLQSDAGMTAVALDALNTDVAALEAAVYVVTDPEPTPDPTPDPQPQPDPEPSAVPVITRQTINLSSIVGLKVQVPADRYARFQTALVLPKTELGVMHSDGVTFLPGLPFHKVNMAAGGSQLAFT